MSTMTDTDDTSETVDVTAVKGVGAKTAENLREMFGSDTHALEAALTIPDWVRENIGGIGEKNLEALQDYGRANGLEASRNHRGRLKDATWEKYEKTYRPLGETTDGRVLFYSGYFQGHSYSTAITRQTLTRDKVNKYIWAFWSASSRDFVFLSETNYPSDLYDRKVASLVEDNEWASFTEWGLIQYQRGRNHELDDWPDNAEGQPLRYHLSDYASSEPDRTLGSMELVGITKDRIAVYNRNGKLVKFVKCPDGSFYRLHGDTRYSTDRDFDLGEFGTIESFVKKLAKEEEWKTYGTRTFVTDEYEKYLP